VLLSNLINMLSTGCAAVLANAGVSFFSALAEGANFKGANLSVADLESGNFEDADFTDAVLEGAFVNNAQLKVRDPCSNGGSGISDSSSSARGSSSGSSSGNQNLRVHL
jgi:uncharacterized protein YjbI with pentapeptide repeats